jgi:hypothetical protein
MLNKINFEANFTNGYKFRHIIGSKHVDIITSNDTVINIDLD